MRAWVEVDLDAIAANVERLRSFVGPAVKVMAVVKSDAYGYGLLPVAKAAVVGGADWLAVADVDEGVALRAAGITHPVLVLGGTPDHRAVDVVRHGLTQAVWDTGAVNAVARAASELGKEASVHVDVDTGMGMTGVPPADAADLCEFVLLTRRVRLGGVFTHFANADADDAARNRAQLDRFRAVLGDLRVRGIDPGLRHACNTGAAATIPDAHFDMVRSGCGIHGLWPFPFDNAVGVEEAMSIKARVEYVRHLHAGSTVSYGSTYTCASDSVVAGVSIGYGQGLPRALARGGSVLVRGRAAPVIGKVCMNRFAVDVTGIAGVREWDEVVICGRQGDARVTLAGTALKVGIGCGEFLVPYVVPRVYHGRLAESVGGAAASGASERGVGRSGIE